MLMRNKWVSYWSMLGTYILIAAIAYQYAPMMQLMKEFAVFLSGGVEQITHGNTPFLLMIPAILFVVAIELPTTVTTGLVIRLFLGDPTEHALINFLRRFQTGRHFYNFFSAVLLEELLSRWFFLGLLRKIPWFSGPIAFYVLFLIGNGLWALIHIGNFTNERDQSILRVLPQFVSGFFLSFVFVKFGLLACVLAHFASNAIIFAIHKIDEIDIFHGLRTGLHAIYAIFAWHFMTKPLSDLLPWFNGGVFSLPGWELADYLLISMFVSSCFALVFDLLLYDKLMPPEEEKDRMNLFQIIFFNLVFLGLLFLTFWTLGWIVKDVPFRILIISVLVMSILPSASASAAMNQFWTGIPDIYLFICIAMALGFWGTIIFLFFNQIINIPFIVLRKLQD